MDERNRRMMDFVDDIEWWFAWIPEWVIGLALVAFAVCVALIVHRLLDAFLHRAFGGRRSLLLTILERTREPGRIALCLAAAAFVLPLAPLDDRFRSGLTHLMAVTCIALVGWIAVRAIDMGAGRYLRNFRVDVEDNLLARKHITQVRVFKRVAGILVVIITVATALMTFDSVRQYGVSLFASAGAAGLIVGLAARPVLSNLIAGVQLAITQPIRIEDAVIVENEWGWVEEIAATYVVVRLWDWRRMVVPLTYFIEKPFQNWTREGASLIGTVILHVDYTADVGRIRDRLNQLAADSKLWDGAVVNLQVIDADARTMELRALVSSGNASSSFDLRCEVREKLIAFIRDEMPESLPRERADLRTASVPEEIPQSSGGKPVRDRPPQRRRA